MRQSPFLHVGFSGPALWGGGSSSNTQSKWLKCLASEKEIVAADPFDDSYAYVEGGNTLVVEEINSHLAVLGLPSVGASERCATFWRLYTFQQVGDFVTLGWNPDVAMANAGGRIIAAGTFGGGAIRTRIDIDEGLRLACAVYCKPPNVAGDTVFLQGGVNVKIRVEAAGVSAKGATESRGQESA